MGGKRRFSRASVAPASIFHASRPIVEVPSSAFGTVLGFLLLIPLQYVNMADKLRTQQELERLQAKYIGTGHPDTTSWEWRTNIARDTYSSIVGHPSQLAYQCLALNEPSAKYRAQLVRKMIQPCGPPPPREGEDIPMPARDGQGRAA